MIKILSIVLTTGFLLTACVFSTDTSANTVTKLTPKGVSTLPITHTEPNTELISQKTNADPNNSVQPKVWVGSVSFQDGILTAEGVWSGGDSTPPDISESQGGLKIGTSYEVELMNCAGYLGKGKMTFITRNGFPPDWRIQSDLETIAPDAKEKIAICRNKSEYSSGNAFALTPPNDKRISIKIDKTDTRKLFSSLPKSTRRWLKNKYASNIHKSGVLSLAEDCWTDIDGDGKVDLIYVFSNYDEEHSSGAIMWLVNGKWKDIGSVQD